MENSEFYNILSSNYDEMIDFENSLKNRIRSLQNYLEPSYKTALDLGCGTGVDSIALAKLGLLVDAVDQSYQMINKAKINSKAFHVDINFFRADIADLRIDKRYDMIVSLGNTFANITKPKIDNILKSLKSMLNSKGRVIIQLINFTKLPQKGIYQLNSFENSEVKILREYDNKKNNIEFIIKITDKESNQTNEIITKIYSHSKHELEKLAISNNLIPEFFGNLAKEPYLESESENLIAVLSK